MKYLKALIVVLIVAVPIVFLSFYFNGKYRQKQTLARFYHAVTLLQKAYPFASFSNNREKFYTMLDKADKTYQLILEYRLEKADKEIAKIEKFAKDIVEKRKSSYVSEAHISDFVGNVHILGGGKNLIKAEIDTRIRDKDVIKCGAKSACKIAFIDGSIFTVKSDSTVVFDRILEKKEENRLNIEVSLLNGKVVIETLGINDFNQDFTVKIRSLSVKFRGNTSAELQLRSGKTLAVYCYDGQVNIEGKAFSPVSLGSRTVCRIGLNNLGFEKYKIPPAPRPEEPINLSTIDRATRSNIAFRWVPVFNVAGYVFQLSKDDLFANVIVEKSGYSGTTLIIPVLNEGAYFWRVAAINDVNERGKFSEAIKFTVVSGRVNDMIDNTPPEVNIEKINVFGSVVIITGKTEPGATVIINNHLVEVDADGKFSFIQKMYQRGKNPINIIARDAAGNETRITKYAIVTVD